MERGIDLSKTAVKFGGYSELARRLSEFGGVPVSLSTCHGWARRDKIPPWRVMNLFALAKAQRVPIVYKAKKRKRKAKPQAG